MKKYLKNILLKILNIFFLKKFEKIINSRSHELTTNILNNPPLKFDKYPIIKKKKIKYDISITIPSFCRSKKGYEYIVILLNQIKIALKKSNITSYEIIIVDNCSKIKLKKLKKKFSNLRIKIYKNKKTIPPYKNFIKSIDYSSGRYVYLHSDDDFISKNFFEEIKKIIKLNRYDLIMWKVKPIKNNKIFNYSWRNQWPRENSGPFKPDDKLFKYPIPSSGYIAKRKFYEKHGCIGTAIEGYDVACGIKFKKFAKKGYFASNTTSYYRIHNLSSGKIDDPISGPNRLKFILNFTNIFFKYFKNQELKKNIFLFIKYYYFLHIVIDLLNIEVRKKQFNKDNKLANFVFYKYWNDYTFFLTKYFFKYLNFKKLIK